MIFEFVFMRAEERMERELGEVVQRRESFVHSFVGGTRNGRKSACWVEEKQGRKWRE